MIFFSKNRLTCKKLGPIAQMSDNPMRCACERVRPLLPRPDGPGYHHPCIRFISSCLVPFTL